MSETHNPISPSASKWRAAILTLALLMAITNLVELGYSLGPHSWDRVGTLGLAGSIEHGKLRVSAVDPHASPEVLAIQPGDLVSWQAPRLGFSPSALNFARTIDRDAKVDLLVEHDVQQRAVTAIASVPIAAELLVNFYAQVVVDLVYAVVGALMIYRRPGDRAVRALSLALICWASSVPLLSPGPVFDTLFAVNQATARVWYQVLVVSWAIQLTASARFGFSRKVLKVWPVWAAASVALSLYLSYSTYYFTSAGMEGLNRLVDNNSILLYLVTIAVLVEGVFGLQGQDRTRIKWGLFIFSMSFLLFPFRIFFSLTGTENASSVPVALVDFGLQLILPIGLLYATVRHRLLDFGFAINRGLVFGVVTTILLLGFFGLEKLSEHFIDFHGREENAVLDAAIALGIFLAFHKIRHRVEHLIEELFFADWKSKEDALRLYVRKSIHITHIAPLIAGYVEAIDRFSNHAPCAIYRAGSDGDFLYTHGTMEHPPERIDTDHPMVVALRYEMRPVSDQHIENIATDLYAFPMIYRGRVDGVLVLQTTAAREAYRPDEIEVLAYSAQQIGVDLAALEADEHRRLAAEHERQARLDRATAQESRAMLELVLSKTSEAHS